MMIYYECVDIDSFNVGLGMKICKKGFKRIVAINSGHWGDIILLDLLNG